jgi:hypothetical protein
MLVLIVIVDSLSAVSLLGLIKPDQTNFDILV